MDIHLLGVSETCDCPAQHVCQSCQGQDERLRAVNAQLLEALEESLYLPMESPAAFRRWKDKAREAIEEAKK